MWDVKCFEHGKSFNSLDTCFTLTMWDVKVWLKEHLMKAIEKFYLNYVGCKDLLHN